MRAQLLRAAFLFSVLALTAASGRSQDTPPPPPPPPPTDPMLPPPLDPTLPPPTDTMPVDPIDIQGTGNKVQFDATSPTAFKIGEIKASGTVTIGAGWTCDAVIVRVYDANNKKLDEKQTAAAPNPNWAITISDLPPGMHKVIATGYFRKGTTADTPKVEALVTVK